MRIQKSRRWLATLLAILMLLTMVPTMAFAAGSTAEDGFYKIVHLDCARKYFSVSSIESIIDTMSEAGYTHLQLAVGNDGLRLLLDDMAVTANDTTYSSDQVTAGIQAGNKAYYDDGKNELTQDEMDTIISYAKGKGIEIIPLINTPGHMDAILDCMEAVGIQNAAYNSSARTVDVTNREAVAFTQALVGKYIDYFAGKGCTIFNMGADEYANDRYTSGGMGFGNLQSTGKYGSFVDYVNGMAGLIKEAGMSPMAFNDGIYFNNDTSSGTFDTDIIISYWSNGWTGYCPASAEFLAGKGFPMVNTHGDYYWVLGKSDWQCSAEKAAGFDYKAFQGGTIDNPVGATFCIWCDYPGAGTEESVVSATADVIKAFGGALPGGGSKEPQAIPGAPSALKVGESAVLTVPESAEWTTSDESVISLACTARALAGTSVTATAVGAGTATVTATTDSTVYTSDITVTDDGGDTEVTKNETITVAVGQTATATIDGFNYANEQQAEDPSIATVQVTGKDAEQAIVKYNKASVTCNTLISSNSSSWKETEYYYLKDGEYYPLFAKRSSSGSWIKSYTYTWGYSKTSSSNDVTEIGTQTTYRTSDTSNLDSVYSKTGTDAVPASTTITFTGVAVGTTYVTIGDTRYTIVVQDKAPDGAMTGSTLSIEYWITNNHVYTAQSTSSASSVTVNASNAASEDGVAVTALVPETAYSDYDGWLEMHYWQAMRLDSNHKQTGDGGVDRTADGTGFTHVRYHGGAWQYKTADGAWHYFLSGDQAVAYYMRHTEITKEITTGMKDWGYNTSSTTPDTSSGNGQVALTVAVVYPDGTVSPAEGSMYADSTVIFNYWSGRDIGIVVPLNNSDYTVSKITVTDGTRASNTGSNVWYKTDTINWDKKANEAGSQWYNETEVWNEAMGTEPVVNGKASNITWSAKNTAKLVLIYLETVHHDTNLAVRYVDDSAGGAEIYNSEIVVRYDTGEDPVTFLNGLKQTSPVQVGAITLDDDAYITNSSGVNQTFNKDITIINGVAAQYKSGLYQYVSAEISSDGKTLTLHYNINSSKLEKSYVLDFGLPVEIPLGDLVDNADDVTNVTVSNTETANVTYNRADKKITYTPQKVMTGTDIVRVQLAYGSTAQTVNVGFIPASNVLYEDGFFEEGNPNGQKGTAAQSTANERYGYDVAYNAVSGQSGTVWNSGDLTGANKSSGKVKFSFHGSGLDLIGDCGTDTGMVYVAVKGATNKAYIIDTYYSAGTLHQVPLLHTTELTNGDYAVTAWGGYVSSTGGSAKARTATYAVSSASAYSADEAFEQFAAQGFDLYEMDDVEMIYFDENSPLAQMDHASMAAYYAAAPANDTAAANTVVRADTQYVALDAFRVYRSTMNDAYAEGEKGASYVNVLEAVAGDASGDTDGKFIAYVDNNGAGEYTAQTYEAAGGPQNEIYLGENQAVAFNIEGAASAQISARAVTGPATMADAGNNGNNVTLSANTEMYYPVAVQNGYIVVQNTSENLLALGNLKLPASVSVAALSDGDLPAVYSMLRAASVDPEPEPEVFTPDMFDVKVNSTKVIRNKIVTLTVTASTDVEYLMVNGKKVKPSNTLLVKWGLSKNYVFVVRDIVKKTAGQDYTIQAYDADGLASAVYTAKG
ncbi:MAG: family 20 glycosylhydrolase [Butyricicoccus pullicaecorum]|nr:family 20 glycosylhydrolase [Butyricicoccus pullicaecorum]